MITRKEIGFTDRPQDIRNPSYIILSIIEYCISDLVLFSSQILLRVPSLKEFTCNPALSIWAPPQIIDINADPQCKPMMSKELEQKTNRHAHSTRDQNTGPFSERKIKEVFSAIDPKQGCLGTVHPKER